MIDEKILDHLASKLANREVEQVILGAILLDKNSYYTNSDLLYEELFVDQLNLMIFKAIKKVAEKKDNDIDQITVTNQCRELGFFETAKNLNKDESLIMRISGLTNRVASSTHIEYHINILHNYWKLRKLQSIGLETQEKCNKIEDPTDIISFINTEIVKLNERESEDFNKKKSIQETLKSMEKSSSESVVRSGIHALDAFIHGFEPEDFVVLAGAASMGKTAAAQRLFLNQVLDDTKPVYFSREMSAKQLTSRLLAMISDVNLGDIRRRNLTQDKWEKINSAAGILEDHDYYIDDKTKDLFHIASKIRKYHLKHGSKFFVIDYLQLVNVSLGKNVNREREVATITRTFKELCLDYGIIIVGLSQLSRGVSKRDNKRPMLSDLRESGAIEQDADFVIFPYRPAYYDVHEKSIPYVEEATWIIAKGRGTGLKDIKVKFKSTRTNYLNGQKADLNEFDFKEKEEGSDETPF